VNERDRLFLAHILEAIADIESFVAAGREGFVADRKTQSAVVRQLEIIGEAVTNLSPALTARERGVPWRRIAGRSTLANFSVTRYSRLALASRSNLVWKSKRSKMSRAACEKPWM
jgi:uncharacterized protein with HEPN domain